MGCRYNRTLLYVLEGNPRKTGIYSIKTYLFLHYLQKRQFLLTLTMRLPANSMSPISTEWVTAPEHLSETSRLLNCIFHKWRVSCILLNQYATRFFDSFSEFFNPFLFKFFNGSPFVHQCHKYRRMYDQTARNRMREKLTASIIFKNRKSSYPLR